MRNVLVVVGLMMLATTPMSHAQVAWDLFEDGQSTSVCDVVNAAGNELVVLSSTQQLMLVSGTDTILSDTFVDADNTVIFEGQAAGSIEFAMDADGFRTLWWMSFDGFVVELDGLSLEPFVSDVVPQDFAGVPCDACEFVDNPPAGVCDDSLDGDVVIDIPPFSVDICGTGVASNAFLAMSFCGFLGLRSVRRP